MRTILHYIIIMAVIPIYGIQVCPFLESLSPIQVILPVVGFLAVQYTLRMPLHRQFVVKAEPKHRVSRMFWLELILFVITALSLMIYNTLQYGFPLESGLKVLVGIVFLGFLATTDLALAEERRVADLVEQDGNIIETDASYFPITAKMIWFATTLLFLLIAVFMLLLFKDLDWIVHVGETIPLTDARVSILKEFAFALGVTLPYVINIILSYARNLNRILGQQNSVMKAVTEGDYTQHVPVSSNDEFGVMAEHTNIMVDHSRARTEELARTRDVTILSLASLAETRDNETGAHILRTQRYVRALAKYLQDHPNFSQELNTETIDLLYKSAPLHDVGKVGIPDAILLKPGKLDEEEFAVMKTHATLGADALEVAERELGTNSFMRYAREIALSHHEKWDGSGYPQGLKGEDIPISGRLMAVADVYDALISRRVYKPPFPHDKAMDIIREGRGKHFDPDVVDALQAVESKFKDIARRFSDGYTETT